MKGLRKKPELMAPAGCQISLRAALDAGCDAVYFGLEKNNMRRRAKNFSVKDLLRIVQMCHSRGVKAYLTLNTIIYEKEILKIKKVIEKAKKAKVDAIICWDFSVIKEAKKRKIPVFISTQMSVSNSESILFFYKNLGIKRFVLARECSLKDIKTIKKNLWKALGRKANSIEIETFIHGAMCVSISGRCFLSEFQFGESANRGKCLQPCRREYLIKEKEEGGEYILGEDYVLSPKDLCTLPFIEKLIEVGISSFKIEGRNRSPEYVASSVSVYKEAIDFYFRNKRKNNFEREFSLLKQKLLKRLAKVYNKGFSAGFFMGKPIGEWARMYGSNAKTRKEYIGIVTHYYSKAKVAEMKIQSSGFKIGDEIMFQGKTTGVFSQIARSIEIDHSSAHRAKRGMCVALKIEKIVRKNDKVYILRVDKSGS